MLHTNNSYNSNNLISLSFYCHFICFNYSVLIISTLTNLIETALSYHIDSVIYPSMPIIMSVYIYVFAYDYDYDYVYVF